MNIPQRTGRDVALAPAPGLARLARAGDALFQAACAAARERWAAWSRRRVARLTRLALSELDDRTLHDIGLHRSEIGSMAAEVSGDAAASRLRCLQVRVGLF